MSTPEDHTHLSHNPFGLLKAILIGIALGFFAVLAAPYILPHRSAVPQAAAELKATPVQIADAKSAKPNEAAGKPGGDRKAAAALQERKDASGQPKVPAAPQPATEPEKAQPALIPAVTLKFPKTVSIEEMTEALQPLLSFKIGDSDAAAVKDAISSASKGDDAGARAAIKKIGDPAAKNFAEWRRLKSSAVENFNEAMAFRKAHPLFPEPPQESSFEKALFFSDATPAEVLKYYTNRNPLTGAGKASLGAALMDSDERERGLRLIKFVWSRYNLEPAVQERFVSRFGSLLDEGDKRSRELLIQARAKAQDDPGKKLASASEGKGLKGAARLRAKRAGAAASRGIHRGRKAKIVRGRKGRRRGELIAPAVQKEAAWSGKARAFAVGSLVELTAEKKEPKADNASPEAKVPEAPAVEPKDGKPAPSNAKDAKADAKAEKPAEPTGKAEAKKPDDKNDKNDKGKKTTQAKAAENAFKLAKETASGPATLLARLKALRREGADEEVWSLLRSLSPERADLADPDKWWDFRRSEMRRALNDDHPATAYAIAKAHGPLDEESRSEAEFLAGWVALRFLKQPRLAVPHFQASSAKGYAREEARSAYWLGQAKLALRARKEAEEHFKEAASRFYTFYGSLAKQALNKGAMCEFRTPPEPSKEAVAAFVKEDAFKAVLIAKQLDLQPLVTNYLLDLVRQLNDPQQMVLALELMERVAPPHVVVRGARIALLRGFAVDAYAFPTLLPKYDPAGGSEKIEPALLNALTRQESDFHTGSVSRVGARGLMQLMPQTAKLVAASTKLKYEAPRLVSDPSYNVTLGSAFLSQLLSGYDGSYVLSLAAYNAGPGRVKQWIKEFGDPRSKASDPVDWIERIPFTETRLYVQRILESAQLYRCRFENGKGKLQIAEDLHRGRPGKVPDVVDLSGSGELEQEQ
jgi:soluble lytic murein transglycosylase